MFRNVNASIDEGERAWGSYQRSDDKLLLVGTKLRFNVTTWIAKKGPPSQREFAAWMADTDTLERPSLDHGEAVRQRGPNEVKGSTVRIIRHSSYHHHHQ